VAARGESRIKAYGPTKAPQGAEGEAMSLLEAVLVAEMLGPEGSLVFVVGVAAVACAALGLSTWIRRTRR